MALDGGKGKTVVAEAIIPADLLRLYMRTTPRGMLDMWHRTLIGQVAGDTRGYQGHGINALTGLFIACGQDVANIGNAGTAITVFDLTSEGDLYASVTVTSLTVATVGGGTHLPTSRECLQILGCYGTGGARKLAEIAAATFLVGELSMGSAIETNELPQAHESYGRPPPLRFADATLDPRAAVGAITP
jgi:hydroxymethylglutaryl-CoA reductase (NADPH)